MILRLQTVLLFFRCPGPFDKVCVEMRIAVVARHLSNSDTNPVSKGNDKDVQAIVLITIFYLVGVKSPDDIVIVW